MSKISFVLLFGRIDFQISFKHLEQELLTLPEDLSSPPVFSGVRVTRSLVLCVCFVDRCLSFCAFSFGHCIVCFSSIYGFWLPLCYLQTLLLIYSQYFLSLQLNLLSMGCRTPGMVHLRKLITSLRLFPLMCICCSLFPYSVLTRRSNTGDSRKSSLLSTHKLVPSTTRHTSGTSARAARFIHVSVMSCLDDIFLAIFPQAEIYDKIIYIHVYIIPSPCHMGSLKKRNIVDLKKNLSNVNHNLQNKHKILFFSNHGYY